jgi:hypothetical protein
MTRPAETWEDLATEAQRQASESAGRADLDGALERYTEEERAAFWTAVGLYYAPKPNPAEKSSEAG